MLARVPAELEIEADDARLDRIADAFALIIDAKSPFTFDHSRRVATYALAINSRLGDRGVDATRLRRAALLHDLGKLTVPNRVLDKPGKLDADEWALIKQHPAYTLSVLERVPAFEEFAIDSANHHEWIDGKGYCRGLTGDELVDHGAHSCCRRRRRCVVRGSPLSRRNGPRARPHDSRK